ncbi:MAG: 3-oxosteroid 1-dehydrogenase [Alphaproteobacteria bacterium]|jgi:3-oxosteroid 1-dehydrogenase|nr:3-oxosteroid 1-dehydrogenase [Alphaproteobacteria bacterium]
MASSAEAFDVIVLGSGIAGLAAALAAQEHGLRPILMEKADRIGGTTTDSYGLIWVGGNHIMRQAGETDSRDDIIRYMTFLGGGELSEERMQALVDRSPGAIEFFESCGIPFRLIGGLVDHYFGVAVGARGPGRTLEAELISGFDLGDWRDKVRTPKDAPYFVTAAEQYAWGGINRYSTWDQDLVRDRIAKDMRGKGVGLVTHFMKALLMRGVPIRLGATVDGLTVGDGRVTGVRMSDGTVLSARKGVVLATGGYEWNGELMRDFDPIPGLKPLSPPSSTGDGLIMGAEIGAAIRRIQNNLNLMLGFYLVPDEPNREPIQCMAGISEMCSPHTIVVNKAGQRFADESYFQSVVPALRTFDTLKHGYANLPCFLIFDQQFAASYSLAHLPVGAAVPASVARADTIPALASKLGIDPGGLDRTVGRFNNFAANGSDEDFQRGALRWRLADRSNEKRRNPSLGPLDRPPFYGMELSPSLGTSSAGLLADANGQVVHQRRHPIPGLYASGVVAARNELGAGYQAGLNLASAMTFSLLAVKHMQRD